MATQNHIWYVGYGSNIDKDRFLCYIQGGQPDGNMASYSGARDRTAPLVDGAITMQHELYFARHSTKWNGGVAFISSISTPDTLTYARKYLVTKEQFEDIAKQETSSQHVIAINFDEVLVQGYLIFKQDSWYGKALLVGMDNGYPLITLTNEADWQKDTRPSQSYLATIMRGINQAFRVNQLQLTDYFLQKRGITSNYTQEELTQLATTAIGK